MKTLFEKHFLPLVSLFWLAVSGCIPARHALFFSHIAPVTDPAVRLPTFTTGTDSNFQNILREQAPFQASGIKNAGTNQAALNKPYKKTPVYAPFPAGSFLQEPVKKNLKVKAEKETETLKKKSSADPGPNAITAILVWLLLMVLSVVTVITAIATGWLVWYLIALGLAILAFIFYDYSYYADDHDASDYIKATLGIAFLMTVAAFGIYYLAQLPSFYTVLLVGAIILFFFIRKIIRYYRKKAKAQKVKK